MTKEAKETTGARPAPHKPVKEWTDDEVLGEMTSNSKFAQARAAFHRGMARIEQANAQGRLLAIIELRRMEFEITRSILRTWNGMLDK